MSVNYPSERNFRDFIQILQEGHYPIKKYLPPIDEEWYKAVSGCVEYVEHTSHYEVLPFDEICARLLYKVAKRHELGDGNKRSSVMVLFLFCLLNDYYISNPLSIKRLAKRAARTKGRINETLMRKRLALALGGVVLKSPQRAVTNP